MTTLLPSPQLPGPWRGKRWPRSLASACSTQRDTWRPSSRARPAVGRRKEARGRDASGRAPVSGCIALWIDVTLWFDVTEHYFCSGFPQLLLHLTPFSHDSFYVSWNNHLSISSPPTGSPKTSPAKKATAKFHLTKEQKTSIVADTLNAKLWDRLLRPEKGEGTQVLRTSAAWCNVLSTDTVLPSAQSGFLQSVEEAFMCICCQEVVCQPVTTPCAHNICKVSCTARHVGLGLVELTCSLAPLPVLPTALLQSGSLQLSQLPPQSAEGPCGAGKCFTPADPDQLVSWL